MQFRSARRTVVKSPSATAKPTLSMELMQFRSASRTVVKRLFVLLREFQDRQLLAVAHSSSKPA